ncbi:hypothetical protein COCMIDRAFT_10448 [Bipolaris oryzae ATCC 44560]|uniref:Metallo-beta-lactamase domain-containing protein n=1 Tax=Bipolaris oryzae ATCC 44560 TaxID=930090 RepID=W6YPL8_COCMI|nr:uncharacterized protein COCMIDRAFT_10448 [Bipolaris oryzae ATCC 44560]EUC39468.1 hypothetical protein COCMIDRAFT_10448 [Bipolaris oryzae ATCC 44560]
MTREKINLPSTDAFVSVLLLDGGSFVGDWSLMHVGQTGKFRLYNWAFHITHKEKHILWDLGLDDNWDCYTPWITKHMLQFVNHVGPRRTVVQQLSERGVSATDIDSVIFSHAHWDHCRPISDVFPNAKARFGPGTKSACQPGHWKDPNSQWDGRFFDPEHATETLEELQGDWKQFGPFERALDYFRDGSFWILDAPGHMPGNLAAAARLQNGEWVVLGSDCCHSRELLDGVREIAEFTSPELKPMSLHTDVTSARDTIAKLRTLETDYGAHVALAHDATWLKKGTDKVLMSLLDARMKVAAKEKIVHDEIP